MTWFEDLSRSLYSFDAVGAIESDSGTTARPHDTRTTPLIHSINTDDGVGNILYSHVLDYHTRTVKHPVRFYDDLLLTYPNYDTPRVTTTIVYCKTIAENHPCDDPDVWTEGTNWVWMESPQLCDNYLDLIPIYFPEFKQLKKKEFKRRCDDVLNISEIKVVDIISDEHALTGMIMAIDDVFPGDLNQATVWKATQDHNAIIEGSFYEWEISPKWDPVTITMIGESVAVRTAMFWNDYVDLDMDPLMLAKSSFPEIEVKDKGFPGKPAIAYFICLSEDRRYQYEHCNGFQAEKPGEVMESFKSTKPDIITIHDSHWAKESKPWNDKKLQSELMWLPTTFDKVLAFNIMVGEAVKNKAKTMFYMTLSAGDNDGTKSLQYNTEKAVFLQMIDSLGCSKDVANSVRLTLLDWARLNCPSVGHEGKKCPKVHGFDQMLPEDGTHPSGETGLWATRIMLALVMQDVSQFSLPENEKGGKFSSWDEALANPITKQLLTLAESEDDGDLLKSLTTSYHICYAPDYKKLEKKFKKLPERKPEESGTYRDTKYATWPR